MKKLSNSILQKDRIFNLTFRVLTIILKFLLSILIVKKLSIYDLGIYGIFQTTIALMVYLLGFDFYTYNARELLKKEQKHPSFYIGNQLLFHAFVYILILPTSLLLFFYNVIDLEYIIYFYFILIAEHISQEIYRLLIVLKKSVAASLTLFLRAGIWILALYFVWVLEWSSQTIRDIFILWCTGAFISIIVGAAYIRFNFKFKVDISWIKKGIKIATPFFIATIFYKVIEFSGRYFLDFFWSKEEVGVFTFYSGLSNAMFIFVHSTVIIVMSPYLIESSNKGIKEFLRIFKSFRNQILYTSTIGFTLAVIFIYPLLIYLDNALLMQNFEVYFLLLVAVTFFCFSYIPHYGLYTFHKDKSLLIASLIGAVVNVGANFAMVPQYGVMGAAAAQVLSMLMLLITKQILYKRMLHE